jgi:DNA-binding transcriptional ArsR family regulator
MSLSGDSEQYGTLTPDEAFSILGNETRIEILRTLGSAAVAMIVIQPQYRV